MFPYTCSPPFWILTLTFFHHLLEPFPYNLHPDRLFRLRLWLEFWRPAGQKTRSRPKSSKEAGCKSCRHSRCATVNAQPHDKVDMLADIQNATSEFWQPLKFSDRRNKRLVLAFWWTNVSKTKNLAMFCKTVRLVPVWWFYISGKLSGAVLSSHTYLLGWTAKGFPMPVHFSGSWGCNRMVSFPHLQKCKQRKRGSGPRLPFTTFLFTFKPFRRIYRLWWERQLCGRAHWGRRRPFHSGAKVPGIQLPSRSPKEAGLHVPSTSIRPSSPRTGGALLSSSV